MDAVLAVFTSTALVNAWALAKEHRWIWQIPQLTILRLLILIVVGIILICFGGCVVSLLINIVGGDWFFEKSETEVFRLIRAVFATVFVMSLFFSLVIK
jgi:hypothetical protein